MAIKVNKNIMIEDTGVSLEDLTKINSGLASVTLSSTGQTYASSYEFGTYTIPSKGTYLMIGYGQLNYYGESGRELFFIANKNWNTELCRSGGVINTYAYSLVANLSYIGDFNAGDVVHIYVTNSNTAKSWAFLGGKVQFIKLK